MRNTCMSQNPQRSAEGNVPGILYYIMRALPMTLALEFCFIFTAVDILDDGLPSATEAIMSVCRDTRSRRMAGTAAAEFYVRTE